MSMPQLGAVAVGLKGSIGFLTDIKKQERFATAQALTDSAWAAQKWTLNDLLPKKFTLRAKSKPWQRYGKYRFKVKPARSKDRQLRAEVESIAPWLFDHEHGGTRDGIEGLGVPVEISARPSPTSVIPRKFMPKKLAKKSNAILMPGSKGGQGLFIPQPNGGFRLFYWLPETVRIKKTLGFEKDAPKVATKHFPKAFDKRFKAALRDSAKRNFKPGM